MKVVFAGKISTPNPVGSKYSAILSKIHSTDCFSVILPTGKVSL